MIESILLSPPVAVCIFLVLTYGLYRLGGVLAASSEEALETWLNTEKEKTA